MASIEHDLRPEFGCRQQLVKADCILSPTSTTNVDSSYMNFATTTPRPQAPYGNADKGRRAPTARAKGNQEPRGTSGTSGSEQQRIVASIEEHFSRLDAVENVP